MSFRKEFNYLITVVSEIDSCQLERKVFLATPHVQISSCRVRSLVFT